jgi:undecaprenyl diphosphate synthase
MDGNGRWASARGMPRTAGHRAGVRTARTIVEAATRTPMVGTLTLYAFSSDNWTRPTPEVGALMRLLRRSLQIESKRCLANGVRLTIIGRRDRLPASLVVAIQEAEALTAHGRNLHLRVAIDYSARESIMQAASYANGESLNRDRFAALLAKVNHDPFPIRDVDLLVRSGGEQRLSDFLLWECAYAEFYFTRCMWPEFTEQEFLAALNEFEARERRFGAVTAQAAS